jgi:hypothetical protein
MIVVMAATYDLERSRSQGRRAPGGCDPVRLTLRSYLWPDELDRLARADAALDVAARHPPPVTACAAERWLPRSWPPAAPAS